MTGMTIEHDEYGRVEGVWWEEYGVGGYWYRDWCGRQERFYPGNGWREVKEELKFPWAEERVEGKRLKEVRQVVEGLEARMEGVDQRMMKVEQGSHIEADWVYRMEAAMQAWVKAVNRKIKKQRISLEWREEVSYRLQRVEEANHALAVRMASVERLAAEHDLDPTRHTRAD